MFSFKDDDFPLLPSPALPNHRSLGNNVGNPASNIMKPVHTKKFDVRCRPGKSNVCNLFIYLLYLRLEQSQWKPNKNQPTN